MCKLLANAGKPQQQQQQHRIAYKKLKLSQMVQEGTRYVYAACASLLFWPIGHPSSAVVVVVVILLIAATVANTLYVHNNNKQRSLTLAYKEIKYLRPRILSAIVTQTNQTKLNSLSFQSHTYTATHTVCLCVCAF